MPIDHDTVALANADTGSSEPDTTDDGSAEQHTAPDVEPAASRHRSPLRLVLLVGVLMAIGAGTLTGWLGYDAYRTRQADEDRQLFLEVAKQTAVNLTTINYTEADRDVQRILDSSTGTFHDDFQGHEKDFVDAVKQAKSTSAGTITGAGIESEEGNGRGARILVAVSVKTSMDGAPQPQPRYWRMRINVQKNGTDVRVANVEFVP